jgi:hypothetical protein
VYLLLASKVICFSILGWWASLIRPTPPQKKKKNIHSHIVLKIEDFVTFPYGFLPNRVERSYLPPWCRGPIHHSFIFFSWFHTLRTKLGLLPSWLGLYVVYFFKTRKSKRLGINCIQCLLLYTIYTLFILIPIIKSNTKVCGNESSSGAQIHFSHNITYVMFVVREAHCKIR